MMNGHLHTYLHVYFLLFFPFYSILSLGYDGCSISCSMALNLPGVTERKVLIQLSSAKKLSNVLDFSSIIPSQRSYAALGL